ncbi:MAG TPA: VIT domain-containing protein, partial [Pyrinomonadaceae bacterium]
MNRKSILKWAALTAICIAAAATIKAQSQTPSSLRALDANGQPTGDCPLKHTDVKAEVSGFISRVTVTQNFENPFAEKIEAVYTFPLPPAAAVDDLTMVIGDRTIKGTILRRADAAAAYTNAKKLGKIASLLDQERPNVFTQQVANILPGQQIRVTISYVEMLKYEDGSYEWSFPMVVAPRYNPTGKEVEPPRVPEGMRAGHDLSLEIDLDAGVPIVAVNSASHEIEVQRVDEKRAVVRLKDQTTIPNKDFVLTYGVAGDSIKDAVLAHHSLRGGFFTLILQPPQRVQAEDVMPKEMVFVLDTSGSMAGFPLNTAKQTMLLALDTLYPHDTFNLITFSGDTEILFPEPVPATPENLSKAKKFLASRKSDGGTEMMKAVKAALDPSDSQYHVRLACFMTDGQVGNDAEILAEVQKHRNARVFAMGFGDAPNRSLLDKMTQYGRGEVDYVGQTGNMSAVARRFNDRVRNPLLTDISVEWSDLSITEVYPKQIPDLFSVRPVILSGRYTAGGKGTIRLKGKMAGQDFVREIPVELPDVENDHDTLSTLWARNKIEDLMSQVLSSTDQVADSKRQEEITKLGLDFKLLTQYTSFVAIDEVMFTGTEDPMRVAVPVEALPGTVAGVRELVTVSSCGSSMLLTSHGAVSNSVNVRALQDLPIQGRTVSGLLTLMPSNGPVATTSRNFSFVVDGVSANSGIAPGEESPGTSASGNPPALTAAGGANGMVTLDAAQEVVIRTAPTAPEHDGATTQLEVTTRSGTNSLHGSAFHFFGNDALDANDWFANARGLEQPPKRLNIFGGTLDGPIQRNRLFFFASYEGMRLSQPLTGITEVPSISARQAAPDALRPFLAAFPVPNGAVPDKAGRADGFSEFAQSFANPARHDAGSLRLQHMLSTSINLLGRYTLADSEASQRGANGFSLNTTHRIRTHAQTVTGTWIQTVSPTIVFDVRANYSRLRADGSYLLDEFGEAAATPGSSTSAFAFDLNSRNAAFMIGDDARNVQRQFNLVGSTFVVYNNHNLKFGADYRRLSPIIGLRPFEQNVLFDGVGQALTGTAARVNSLTLNETQTPLFNTLSLYAQDQWRQSHRFTLTYGLRWALAPAPSIDGALAVDQVVDPTTLTLKAPGTPLWRTT